MKKSMRLLVSIALVFSVADGTAFARAVRGSAHTSVNRNVNVNRNANVNVNRNLNVNRDVDVHVHGGYYGGGYGCCYHPVATAAAVTATAMVTAAVVGSIVNSIPPSCTSVIVNGFAYQQCGSTWYQPQGTQFVVVNPPY